MTSMIQIGEKKTYPKILQVCPKCEGKIAQGPTALLRHCFNKPDHVDVLAEVQTILQKKRQLASLKQELAAERSLAKRAKPHVPIPSKSSENSDTAPAEIAEPNVMSTADEGVADVSDQAVQGKADIVVDEEEKIDLTERIKKALEFIPADRVIIVVCTSIQN